MSFTNRELYMLLGVVVFLALAAAVLAPRELKEGAPAPRATTTAERAAPAAAPLLRLAPRVSPNGRYSTATWAPAPKPRPDDPTPY
jgi:hypothetical protein